MWTLFIRILNKVVCYPYKEYCFKQKNTVLKILSYLCVSLNERLSGIYHLDTFQQEDNVLEFFGMQ